MSMTKNSRKTPLERYERDWTLTLTCLALAGVVCLGIYSSWRYLAHDAFLIFSVIVPSIIVAIVLLAAGLNGRRHAVTGIWSGLSEMLLYWWM